jgi:1-acyl-sn-glycerol-3-phosphate acyltransferase
MKLLKTVLTGLLLLFSGSTRASEPNPQFGPLNLSFEENRGQAPSAVQFLARGHGYNLMLTPEGTRLLLRHGRHGLSLTTTLAGANLKPVIRGEGKQPGKVHYLRGGRSLTNIPTYARVKYERVYPGVDLAVECSRAGQTQETCRT